MNITKLTIDSGTIEWIEEEINPQNYNSYADFIQEVLSNFDGRYVRSKGFRSAMKELYENSQTELAIELIQKTYQNGDFKLAEYLLEKFNRDGQL